MQRGVALVAHQQTAVAMQPGEVALHHPALAPEPLARLAAAAGDPRDYTAAAKRGAVAARAVAQVRVQLGGPPARCQSRSRFHSVIPQHPSSCGKCSQGMPVCWTKMIPVSATRLGTGVCPRGPGGRVGGGSGSTIAHNSSLTHIESG